MKKKTLLTMFLSLTTVSVLTVCAVIAGVKSKRSTSRTNANEPTYTRTLNSDVFAMSSLTTTYQQNVQQSFGENLPLVMNYSLAKKDANNNLVLAPSGRVFNYHKTAEFNGKITNIKSVTVQYSGGSLFIQEGLAGSYENYGPKSALVSGTEKELISSPNYVMITNATAETTITALTVEYSCVEAGWDVERLGETYNGKAQDGNTYELTREGSNVSVAGQTGTIALDNSGNFTMTLASGNIVYTGSVSSDYRTLNFSEKSGAGAALAPTIGEMNRVYVMDDFESYPDRGTGYSADQTSIFTVSNLRAAYYVDAGSGSGATWVSGSGFKIPSTSNYLNLSTNGTGPVHSGNKAMLLQGQKAGWVRAWSREVWDQNQQYNFGRGNRLSFWVHSGRNNPDGTGVNASNVQIRVQVYYQNFVLTESTRNSTTYGTGAKDFTINSGADWTKCTVNINPDKQVYAINIMINNSGISTDYVFMPIDDITIYTEPVFVPTKQYNESATHITKTYHGTVNIKHKYGTLAYTVKVGLGANGYTYAYAGANMQPTGHTINGDTLVMETNGSFDVPEAYQAYFDETSYDFGTWTGTFNANKTSLTVNKNDITGSIADIINDSSVTLVEDNVLANGTQDTATLQGMFSNQSGSSSWDAYTASDRMTQITDYYIEGNSAIKMAVNGTTRTRAIINPSLAEAQSLAVESVAFWFYIPAGNNFTVSLFSYDNYTPTSGSYQQLTSVEYKADGTGVEAGWHYVNCGVPKEKNKNIAIGVFTNPGAQPLVLDYITYF